MEVDKKLNDKIWKLIVKGQNDRKIEIQIASKLTIGDFLQRIDDLTKNKESWTHYTVGNTRLILNGASMENALITDKYDMTTTLDNIIGLTDGSLLTLVQGQPNRNRRREVLVDSPAFSNLAQVRTLIRNVRACYLQAQRDQVPIYDNPEEFESLPSQPSKFDNILRSKRLLNPMAHGHFHIEILIFILVVGNLDEAAEVLSILLLKFSHILAESEHALRNDDKRPKQVPEYQFKLISFRKMNKLQMKIDKRRSQRKINRRNRYR